MLLFSRSVISNFLWPHGLQQAKLPCPSSSPRAYSNSCSLSRWCHPKIWSSVVPFSYCFLSFPVSGSFPMNWLFVPGNPSIGTSPSGLPMNIQGWFSLRLIGLISLQSKGHSTVFPNTTAWKHQFFGTQSFYSPSLTSIHDYWKNHSFDCMDLCWHCKVPAF